MKADQTMKEAVRVNVLTQLDRVHLNGFTAEVLLTGLNMQGIRVTADQLASELDALEEEGFVKSAGSAFNKAILIYKRTEAARLVLTARGLI